MVGRQRLPNLLRDLVDDDDHDGGYDDDDDDDVPSMSIQWLLNSYRQLLA